MYVILKFIPFFGFVVTVPDTIISSFGSAISKSNELTKAATRHLNSAFAKP
jgi:hypothetical protein